MREMCRGVGLKSCVVWIIGPAYSSSGQESSCASGSTSPPKIPITAPTRRTKTTVTPTPTPKVGVLSSSSSSSLSTQYRQFLYFLMMGLCFNWNLENGFFV